MIHYGVMPRTTPSGLTSFGTPYLPTDHWTSDLSSSEFMSRLQDSDYLLLARTDQQFWLRYGVLFDEPLNQLKPLLRYPNCLLEILPGHKQAVFAQGGAFAYLFKIVQGEDGVKLMNIS